MKFDQTNPVSLAMGVGHVSKFCKPQIFSNTKDRDIYLKGHLALL